MSQPKTIQERVQAIEDEVRGVAAQFGINSATKGFLANIKLRRWLTEGQEKWLRDIESRVFGGDDAP